MTRDDLLTCVKCGMSLKTKSNCKHYPNFNRDHLTDYFDPFEHGDYDTVPNEVTVLDIAKNIAEHCDIMLDLAYAEVLYNSAYYHRDYLRLGGNVSPRDWQSMCEQERKPQKKRKSLR